MKKIENRDFFFPVRYQTNWKQVEIYDLLLSTNAHVVSRHITITTGRTTKIFSFCERARLEASSSTNLCPRHPRKSFDPSPRPYKCLILFAPNHLILANWTTCRKFHDDVYLTKSSMLSLTQLGGRTSGSGLGKRTRRSCTMRAGYCTEPGVHGLSQLEASRLF